MKSLGRQKILLGILGIVVVIAIFYYSNLWKSKDVITALTDSPAPAVGQEVLILVEKIKFVTIDPSIFQDSLFSSLKDISVQVSPENVSRPNPFAPIGFDSGVVQISERITAGSR